MGGAAGMRLRVQGMQWHDAVEVQVAVLMLVWLCVVACGKGCVAVGTCGVVLDWAADGGWSPAEMGT